jgi:SAM-dependent methyltransferase
VRPEQVESDYYAFMGFDSENARSVLGYYTRFFEHGPVLELASGPGTFLDILTEQGIECRGVDIDHGMVAESRKLGHDVALADALEHLRALADVSLHGLFAAHFLEHLTSPDVQALYTEAARVLSPGGVFVAVVPNAACLAVLTFDFWKDPTHVRFYDPIALQFFARQAGLDIATSGGNPNNHPGPPAGLVPAGEPGSADISDNVADLVRSAQSTLSEAKHFGSTGDYGAATSEIVAQLGHLIATLNKQTLLLGHEVAGLRAANRALLAQLYPPNEVYVVATKPGDAGTAADVRGDA